VDPDCLPETQEKYSIIPGKPRDFELVADLYNRHPVFGYDVKSVSVIHNDDFSVLFAGFLLLFIF
jgi:hypothetical protein